MSGMASSLSDLRSLTDDKDSHDSCFRFGVEPFHQQYYLDELNRRYQERQTRAMLGFTKWITAMTAVITLATLVSAGLTVAVLLQR